MGEFRENAVSFLRSLAGKEDKPIEPEVNAQNFFDWNCDGVEEDVSNLNDALKELELSKIKKKEEERRLGITGKRSRAIGKWK